MTKDGQTLSAMLHDDILEMIIDSGAESENMLLTERELVEKFNVSKAPVREALLKLCSEDVLKSIPRCGYVVVRLGEKSGQDNLAVRLMLELSSMEQYFDAFTPQRIQLIDRKLLLANEAMKGGTDIWKVWQCNMEFHCALIDVSNNPYLVKHLTECIEVERRFYAQNHWRSAKRFEIMFAPQPHENIMNAIKEKDKALAISLLREDIIGKHKD